MDTDIAIDMDKVGQTGIVTARTTRSGWLGQGGGTELNPQVPYLDGRIHPALALRAFRLQQNATIYSNDPFAATRGSKASVFIPISL